MYCSQCGAAIASGGRFCMQCGAALPPAARGAATPPPLPPGPPPSRADVRAAAAPPPAPAPAPAAQSARRERVETPAFYRVFGRRAAALLVDIAIWFGVLVILSMALAGAGGASEAAVGLTTLGWFLVPLLYKAAFESSSMQATPGKRLLGIKVATVQGERASFGRAFGRSAAWYLNGIGWGLPYLVAAATRRRQGLHDYLASTVVVRAATEPEEIATAEVPAHSPGVVIAVIAIVGGLFVVGILAAIAIPAYQDYTIRAQVVEGLNLASDYKAAVAEAAGSTPLADIDTGMLAVTPPDGAKYVESIEVTGGTIAIVYGRGANALIAGGTVELEPAIDESGMVQWACGYRASGAGTDVEPKYLPVACRPE